MAKKSSTKPAKQEKWSDSDDVETLNAISTRNELSKAKAQQKMGGGGPYDLTRDPNSKRYDLKDLEKKYGDIPGRILKRIDGSKKIELGEAARKRLYGEGSGDNKAGKKKVSAQSKPTSTSKSSPKKTKR